MIQMTVTFGNTGDKMLAYILIVNHNGTYLRTFLRDNNFEYIRSDCLYITRLYMFQYSNTNK